MQTLAGAALAPEEVPVAMDRTLAVPAAAGAASRWTFQELCASNVGASDYIALVNRYHTIALFAVPVFSGATRSEAYRFVKLVDLMYEHRCKLLISAEGYPADLFRNVHTVEQGRVLGAKLADDAVVDDNIGFAKDRVESRLIEMGTIEYAIAHAERHEPRLVQALREVQARGGPC